MGKVFRNELRIRDYTKTEADLQLIVQQIQSMQEDLERKIEEMTAEINALRSLIENEEG